MSKLYIYTGDGKGKTTAALGAAFRACGHRKKVVMVQFCKSVKSKSGEYLIQKKLKPYLTIRCFGRSTFIINKPRKKDLKEAEKAWRYITNLDLKKIDLLILDELNIALYFKLLDLDEIIKFLRERPRSLNIIITGRKAPRRLIKMADLVTEMKEVKHYYRKGQGAVKGVDY